MLKMMFAILMAISMPAMLLAQSDRLVAPQYPGSVKEIVQEQAGSASFYTKDGHEKVIIYYEQLFGKTEEQAKTNKTFIKVDQGDEAEDSPDYIEGPKLGVTISSKPGKDNYFIAQAMAQLQSAYLSRFSGTSTVDKMKHVNDAELQNELKKYAYLKRSFYPMTKTANNSYKGIEELLYDKFFASPEEIRENKMNDLMEQYTSKIQEGDMDGAARISEKMNSLSRASVERTDNWETALKYLKELEKLAYATKITVDKQR